MNLIEKEQKYILQTYKRYPIVVEYAQGTRIYDKDGNEYLDFLAGIAVNLLGHSHPKVIQAIENQIRRYMHLSNYFYQDVQIELAERILKLSGYSKVFFTNSGTEANEGALKIVRRWGNRMGKKTVIAFTGGFHGRTYGALSLMDKPHYKELMYPFLNGVEIVPFNDVNALKNTINYDTAGVFIEFIQGEGGISEANKQFIQELWDLKQKHNFLVVADEVQSGIFRTGKLFAFQHWGVIPDIVTIAKGFGGGLPLGGILVSSELEHIFEKGMHGTTFGGNAVSCAAGIANLEVIFPGLIGHINFVSDYLDGTLKKIMQEFPEKIVEVRGRGLMRGLVLDFEAIILVEKLLEERIITNATSRNVLRLVPPLIITNQDVDLFYNGLKNALQKI